MKVQRWSPHADRRRETRREDNGVVFFSAADGVHEGRLRNLGRCGVFIETTKRFAVGEHVTVAMPHSDEKRRGRIMWRDHDGFGVRLSAPAARLDLRLPPDS